MRTEKYTVQQILELRLQKKQEIQKSKERIMSLTGELFAPQRSKNKMENMMQHINAGIAAYDGLRTGLMMLKRIRSFFRKKKK